MTIKISLKDYLKEVEDVNKSLATSLPEKTMIALASLSIKGELVESHALYSDLESLKDLVLDYKKSLELNEDNVDALNVAATQSLDNITSKLLKQKSAALAGMPNYRYKVGDFVYIKDSGRYGKVIGASKEGGVGRQMYEVRTTNGNTSICSANELVRDKRDI